MQRTDISQVYETASNFQLPTNSNKYVCSWQRENMFFYNFSVSPEGQIDHGSESNNMYITHTLIQIQNAQNTVFQSEKG